MTSPHSRIHRYFVIRSAGTPSSTVQLEYASACHRFETEPPKWLIRHCEVGDALAALPFEQFRAVVTRWEAAITVEECGRAIRVAEEHKRVARRSGEDVSDWRVVVAEAELEDAEARRVIARAERGREYSAGMDALVGVLRVVEGVAG